MVTVTLSDMLKARELRAEEQVKLIKKYGRPVISCTLNIPGECKDFWLTRKAFELAFESLEQNLSKKNITVLYKEFNHKKTGSSGFIVAEAEAARLKEITLDLEDGSLGRLLDFDVIDTEFNKLQREIPRRCLICDEEAHICGRSKRHNGYEVFNKVLDILKSNIDSRLLGEFCAQTAANALLFEAAVTPKPGLVDRNNQGAHKDMDFFTFISSVTAIFPFFEKLTLTGYEFAGDEEALPKLFDKIRPIGIEAEKAMLCATKGVNTHKGAIFSLGCLCCAYGYIAGKGQMPDYSDLCQTVAVMTAGVSQKELSETNIRDAASNGEKLYVRYGVRGIRGEVESGFKTVREYGLPVFSQLYTPYGANKAGTHTLLSLMSALEDTNILWRCGEKVLAEVKRSAKEILEEYAGDYKDITKPLLEMDAEFIRRNISPGGSADLLAVTMMVYFLINGGTA